MAYELKDLQGSLFVNDKQGNDRRPDMKGKMMINGQLYYLSSWKQQTSAGQLYLSLKAELAQQQPLQQSPSPAPVATNATTDEGTDDFPF